jgi:hypothetical protein
MVENKYNRVTDTKGCEVETHECHGVWTPNTLFARVSSTFVRTLCCLILSIQEQWLVCNFGYHFNSCK